MGRFPSIRSAVRLVCLLSFLIGSLFTFSCSSSKNNARETSSTSAYADIQVAYVHDGDTFRLVNGQKVRLLGIDTPEITENPKLLKDAKRLGLRSEDIMRMGHLATDYTRSLLDGQRVRLEFDVRKKDKYGRLLAYVYRKKDGLFINEQILRNGYAYPMIIPPNIRYADEFKRLFLEARKAGCGLWKENAATEVSGK